MKRRKLKSNIDVHNGFGDWGGYMDAKVAKLDEQFAQDALKNPYKETNLFAGISIFVNGLTNPSADVLKRIMMTHGGVYHAYHRNSTTFVIASNLPDVKIRQITSAKIISPQWVVDCVNEKRILDYSKYLLYTNAKESQPKIAFKALETVAKCETTKKLEPMDIEPIEKVGAKTFPIDFMRNLEILNVAIQNNDKRPIVTISPEPNDKNTIKIENKKNFARTAVDPNFLTEFYNNSRLHHIATLGAYFKNHILRLREQHNGTFPIRDQLRYKLNNDSPKLMPNSSKVIMHIDMDCFFVSVGLRTRPHLNSYPIAVTHSKGHNSNNNLKSINGVDRKKEMELYAKRHEEKYKLEQSNLNDDEKVDRKKSMPLIDNTISLSEIASCSYEARKMGVKNGMFVGAALKLCPNLKTIPYDFDEYKEVAHILYDTITQYTMDVEAVSCDEMFVNLSDVLKIVNCTVDEFVTHVRDEIFQKTKCPCSAGCGENRLQARMATKKAKPNGQFHLLPENVEDYFKSILISDLPGVGYSTTLKLNNLHIKTCADLQQMPLSQLQHEFGKKLGETLHQFCRGIDHKPLSYDQVRKSVSAEVNYGIRFTEEHELNTFLDQLCNEVHNRLNEISAKAKSITLKYMVRAQSAPIETAKFMGHGFCDNVTKSITLSTSTCDLNIIKQTVFNIKNILNVPAHELRGIGIQISKLDVTNKSNKSNPLKSLFEKVEAKRKQESKQFNEISYNKPLVTTTNDSPTANKSIFRKIKSFSGTPTQGIHGNCKRKSFGPSLHKIYEELDLSVLAELPDHIRIEVLEEQNRVLKENQVKNETTNEQQPGTSRRLMPKKLENDFGDEVKSTFPKAQIVEISEGNILCLTTWRQVLSNWLDSYTQPLDCDIDMIRKYFEEYAKAHKFSELVLALKLMHRKIEIKSCYWHRVYYSICNVIQHQMGIIFGPNFKLYIEESFNCSNCSNK